MMSPSILPLAAAVAALSASGCALYPGTARPTTFDDLRREEGWTLLESVPFVPQASEQDCGAASLAMVLGKWGVTERAESLERECAAPGVTGLRASALRDAARRRGLAAFVFQGRVEDLAHELERGRPVVVGLVKSCITGPTAHFEVVVGLDPRGRQVALQDPAVGLVRDSLSGFEAEWAPAGEVAMVVFRRDGEAVARDEGGP